MPALSRDLLSTLCLCPYSLTTQQQQLAFLERGNSIQNKNHIILVTCSHGIIECYGLGGILKPTQPQPAAMGRATSYQLNLPRAPSNFVWSTCRDGAPTGSVGNHHEVQSFFPSCVTRESKTDVAELRQASRSPYQHLQKSWDILQEQEQGRKEKGVLRKNGERSRMRGSFLRNLEKVFIIA